MDRLLDRCTVHDGRVLCKDNSTCCQTTDPVLHGPFLYQVHSLVGWYAGLLVYSTLVINTSLKFVYNNIKYSFKTPDYI